MNSKDKGGRGEREFASFLRDHGFAARRGQQYHGGPGTPDVRSDLPFHVEVKRVERLNLRDATAQAEGDCGGRPWLVAHRWNHGPWLLTVKAETFLEVLRRSDLLDSPGPPPRDSSGVSRDLRPLTFLSQPALREAETAGGECTSTETIREEMKITELYPSRWLKAADVTRPVLATMAGVVLEEIADGEQKPVLSFQEEHLKPMVLNRTNALTIEGIYGEEVEDWAGQPIVLFSTKVPFEGRVVDAIRVRAPRPQVAPAKPAPAAPAAPASAPATRPSKLAEAVPGDDPEDDVNF